MWHTILANPDAAAQMCTAYDQFHAFKDLKLAKANFAAMLKSMPTGSLPVSPMSVHTTRG